TCSPSSRTSATRPAACRRRSAPPARASPCRCSRRSPRRSSSSSSPPSPAPPCTPRRSGPAVRVWVDLTNSPHVPVLAPLVRVLRERGDEVAVTARRFAQTVELAELFGLDATVVGEHGGADRLGKA